MPLPSDLVSHAHMQGLLNQLRKEIAEGAVRGSSTVMGRIPQHPETRTTAMLACIYAAKLIAEEPGQLDMTELYHAFLAAEVPAYRVGKREQ